MRALRMSHCFTLVSPCLLAPPACVYFPLCPGYFWVRQDLLCLSPVGLGLHGPPSPQKLSHWPSKYTGPLSPPLSSIQHAQSPDTRGHVP